METETTALKIAVEEPATWARRLTITVPAERVERERAEVAKKLASQIRLPGFRQGKVPPRIVEQRFGPHIQNEMLEKVVGDAYKEALQQEGFQPITQGQVDHVHYHPGEDLTFHVEFEIRPEIALERLSGFRVTRQHPTVGDEQVDQVLDRLRNENAAWRGLGGVTPLVGDAVDVEITPLPAGEAPGEPRRYQIVLGEGQAVPDVEDAIRTLQPGQDGEFDIDIAVEEGDEPRTQHVRIRLVEAKRPEPPALDDEFAKGLGDFESMTLLRSRIREDLEREADMEAERAVRHDLIEQVIEANAFEVPDSLLNQYLDQILRPREGADPERVAEMRRASAPAAEQSLKRMLVIERIAELQGLHATQDEVDGRVEALAERAGRPVGEVWAQLQKSGRLQQMEEEITEEKVFEFLKANSTID